VKRGEPVVLVFPSNRRASSPHRFDRGTDFARSFQKCSLKAALSHCNLAYDRLEEPNPFGSWRDVSGLALRKIQREQSIGLYPDKQLSIVSCGPFLHEKSHDLGEKILEKLLLAYREAILKAKKASRCPFRRRVS